MEHAQLCLILCSSMGCSPPGPSVHGILQKRILEWGCNFLLQLIFLTQGSNSGPQHCRRILYHVSHQGNLRNGIAVFKGSESCGGSRKHYTNE